MFWADRKVEAIKETLGPLISSGQSFVIRDEKTASGRVHVGSMRGVAIHGVIDEILKEQNIPHQFLYEINDFDPMDGLPIYLDQEKYKPYLGKQLLNILSPDGQALNYAEYFGEEFKRAITAAGFTPTYYRASELYLSGRMNEVIRIALQKADIIRQIYKEVSGSKREETWLPLNVVCEQCGKVSTTVASDFDGDTVAYRCRNLEWTEGCGHEGRISPFDGKAKLPWKVEWPAKFKVMEVKVEGAGKDHSTKGGARDVANHIARDVFDYEPPVDLPYEFFLVGGRKMSSSKGQGSTAIEMSELLPPHIFRLAFLGKDINQQINFDLEGDTVPILFDTYDRLAESYFSSTKDDNARLFELTHLPEERLKISKRFLPRFSQIAFLVQMPHVNLEEEVARMKGEQLTVEDKEELELRAKHAKFWLSTYAPEDFRYEIQQELPKGVSEFTDAQRSALKQILAYVEEHQTLDGQELHTALHEIRKGSSLEPKDFFGPLYISILGKDSGPKAGWFVSVLNRDFLIQRLKEVTK